MLKRSYNSFLKTHNILKLVVFYIVFILLCTILLQIPIFINPGQNVNLLDAFFMANSSVATTGLTVFDYRTTYNYLGWLVLIICFNVGGLGIIVFNTLIITLVRKKLNYTTTNMVRLDYNQEKATNVTSIIKDIVKYFLLLELVGTCILFIRMGVLFANPLDCLMNALFLASSAISGSGFYDSTIINGDYIAMWTCCVLMIFSFIGYPVILDLKGYIHAWHQGKKYKFSTFTKISVLVNVVTTLVFMIIFVLLEYNNALAGYSLFEKLNMGLYISLSTKSVGLNLFNDINTWTNLTLFVQTIFMLIGGAPSSACGGIKTNAIYIFWCYLKSLFKSNGQVIINKRKIPDKTIKLSLMLIILFVLVSGIATVFINFLNPSLDVTAIWYDVVSGFTTTGFSTGVLQYFDNFSIFIMSILMMVGRIGVLNILLMLHKNNESERINYIEQNIAI